MTPAEKLRANIRAHMQDHDKMSIRALARLAGISKSALIDFLAEKNSSLTFDSMAAIAAVFDTGVGALLGEETADGPLHMIAYASIHPSELNPRRYFNQADIEKLAFDIQNKGILQNLIVRADPDKHGLWLLVAGERRLKAVDLLVDNGEWSADCALPCKVIEADAREHILTALSENLEREDLDPLEEAGAYKVLVEQFGMTPLEIGGRFARDKRHILYRLSLLDLGEAAIVAMRENVIGPAIGRHIARLKLHELQQSVVDQIRAGTLAASEATVRQRVGEILSRPNGKHEPGKQINIEDPPQTAEQHRHDYPGADAEAWIQARNGGQGWVGWLYSAFDGHGHSIAAPLDWPTPEAALGAAATTLASAMRDAWARVDQFPAERVKAKAIMLWANGLCKQYGNPPVTLPGEAPADKQPTDEAHLSDADNGAIDIENQLPADAGGEDGYAALDQQDPPAEDPPAEDPDGESNEQIAAFAASGGVEQRDPAEYAEPAGHPTLADKIEMGDDGWPVPKPGYFIEHPRAVDPEYQFMSVTLRGIGKMPEKLTLYDPRNQAHAEYVRVDEE